MKKFIAAVLISTCGFDAQAQNEDSAFIRRIDDELLLNSTAYKNLEILTKQIGARLSGSPQMVKAEEH